jgi:hypothetical protein
MAFSQKLFTSLHNYSDPDTRIGELNRIWYDSINNVFRVQLDKTTPGGTVIGGSSTNLSGYATLTTTQTLTNKTLTSPVITNPNFSGTFAFSSTNTTTPAMTLTASNLNDGVGIMRFIGSEPDINFNQVAASPGFNTFTFEYNGDPKIAMGRRNDHSFYITRNDGVWHDNALVLNYSTGVLSVESGISVPTVYFSDETSQTTAYPGIPGPFADDIEASAYVAFGNPYYRTNGQVFVRLA